MANGLFSRAIWAPGILAGALLLTCVVPAAADLVLDPMTWDFGSMEQEESRTQKIVLTNTANQLLKIEKVELPAGCSTTPSLDNTEIQAKQKLEVEFTLDAKDILGKVQEYAHIFWSESEKKGIVSFTFKGDVSARGEPRLRVSPQTWDFRTVTVGETRRQTFRCENVGTADLKIEKVQIYDSRFKIERNIMKETLAPGEKADFAVAVTSSYPGRYDADFYVKSNSLGRSFTKLSIKGYAVSKTRGVVLSEDLSSVTNNTSKRAEVTRTDKDGTPETIVVERGSQKSFPRPPSPRPSPTEVPEYTLTIKLLKPPPPTPVEKTEEPGEKAPEPTPEAETEAPKPEIPETATPSPTPEPSEPPAPAPEQEQPEKPAPEAAPEAERSQPPEEKTRPPREPSPDRPDQPQPSGTPGEKKEETPDQPEEKKEAAPPAAPSEEGESTKPPEEAAPKPGEPEPPEEGTASPSGESPRTSGPEEAPRQPPGEPPRDSQ